MNEELFEAYEAICTELGLATASEHRFQNAGAGDPVGAGVVRLGNAGHTWVLVRDDRRDGCERCLAPVATFIDHFYSGDADAIFSDTDATHLLTRFHVIHDLSIAVTNAYGAQNWSCAVAASDCLDCAGAHISITPPALCDVASDLEDASVRSMDTGGERSRSAESFVNRNRWAFGFASVVGNPVHVSESSSVALVNAPIRTSVDIHRCEIAGGKGTSLDQALASCLGEALERYALATADRRGVVCGTRGEIAGAIDVATTFGFPVLDAHPSITPLADGVALEWMGANNINTGSSVRIPANFALCPYVSSTHATIVAGSTNGAACGATSEDAKLQGLREIVERDAFWYYARTGADPIHIDPTSLDPHIIEAMADYDGTFSVTLLPNPFKAPVANVAFVARSGFQAEAARGSGHASTIDAAVRRAFAECIQMLYSLDSGIEVEAVQTDMRSLWFRGQASQAMPNFFTDAATAQQSLDDARELFAAKQTAKALVESAAHQGLSVFEIPLVSEGGFAVTKVVMSGASVADATYFASSERVADFASLMAHPIPEIQYRDSLFM